MCGRFTLAQDEQTLVEAFDIPALTFDLAPRFNIAPGQSAVVVAQDRSGRRAGMLRWGFVPARTDDPGAGFINARAETVALKPSFREAFARRRCLVPADGFYEWQRAGETKTPRWFHPADGTLFAFAGIWESWTRPGTEPRHTFAILTTTANDDLRPTHDRMPVLVMAADRDAWLDGETDSVRLASLLGPAPQGRVLSHAVSMRVNRASDDDAALIVPITELAG